MFIRSKFFGAFVVFALSMIPILSASDIANAAASGTMPASMSANSAEYRLLSASGTTPSVSGFTGTIRVVVTTTNGTSKMTTTTGLTAPTGYSSADWTSGAASLGFEGSQSAINAAIETLSFKGTTVGVAASVRVNANLGGAAYNPANGHSYEVVSTSPSTITWANARAAAKLRTFNGQTGYLATITSADEQTYLYSKTQTTGWIGASDGYDVSTNQIWKWADGPEAGQTFWTTACGQGYRGICASTGMYNFWNNGEPNGVNSSEDNGEFGFGSGGQWNDCQDGCGRSSYIVEYGGCGGAVAETFDATTAITVAGTPSAPTGLTLTPGDSQISLSFNEVSGANLNGGTIARYEYQQDSGTWVSLGTLTTATITGLTNSTSYTFAVRTITTAGTTFTSAASGLVSGTPVAVIPVVENSPTPTPTPTPTHEHKL